MQDEHRFAVEDEDYPIGFSDPNDQEYEREEEDSWDDEEDYWYDKEDYYDFPDDDGDGLFDPMEAEKP